MQSQLDFSIHPLKLEFRSLATEQEFQEHHLVRTSSSLRTTLIFCGLFYVAFALTDAGALGYTRETAILLLARMLVALTAAGGLYLAHRHPTSVLPLRLAATAAETVGMSTFMLVVWYRPAEVPWHAMSICIMLIVVYIFIPNRLVISTGIAVATTLTFIAIVVRIGTLKPADLLTMSMLLLLANSFGLVAARRYHRIWREEYRVQSLLTHLSVRDHLTGCYNRRYLNEVLLAMELARSRHQGLPFAVILCDIDHFKSINDIHGHLAGDAVLRTFSAVLQTTTRQHVDSVVRYGGEEFLVLLPQTDRAGAEKLAERLRSTFERTPAEYGGQSVSATASFGVLAIDAKSGPMTDEAIFAAADKLLYAAKRAGRNRVQSGVLANSSNAIQV
ncbi:MAG TPA: GGDEF domain-containing protein [Paraburkholderia sp.]|uniref:GGDEF domain-containing protein n=1 Tax=Paraburkholderia sp. TaxID=1926495 RepID=UPI002B498EF7|nr:GGDEF domain-containing protein [Paraburkholderia sp.]HKR46787.1 GGDEF domain-containing protein [Paraburkholderia sp.]